MRNLLQILRYINQHPLSSRHKVKAYVLFFKWQLSQRLMPYPVEFPFVGTTKLLVKRGQTGATGSIYTGLHEFVDMAFLLHFLKKEDQFVDIGANVGSYTVLAAGHIGATCISIEPLPKTFGHLMQNIKINNIEPKVTLHNCAMGAKRGNLTFTSNLDTVNHVVLNESIETENTVDVPVETLDTILNNQTCPALIKIDVEGFEQEVLNGASVTLANNQLKAIIIELNGSGLRYGFLDNNIHQQLLSFGFLPYSYDPYKRVINKLEKYGNDNTIYLRDLPIVEDRVKSAPFVELFSERF